MLSSRSSWRVRRRKEAASRDSIYGSMPNSNSRASGRRKASSRVRPCAHLQAMRPTLTRACAFSHRVGMSLGMWDAPTIGIHSIWVVPCGATCPAAAAAGRGAPHCFHQGGLVLAKRSFHVYPAHQDMQEMGWRTTLLMPSHTDACFPNPFLHRHETRSLHTCPWPVTERCAQLRCCAALPREERDRAPRCQAQTLHPDAARGTLASSPFSLGDL